MVKNIGFYDNYSEFSSSHGGTSTIRLKMKNGTTQYMSPEPLLSFSENKVVQGNSVLGWETSVTLSAYVIYDDDSSNMVANSSQMMSAIKGVQGQFDSATELQVFSHPESAAPAFIFPILNPVVSVDEQTFYNFLRYKVSFTSFSNNYGTATSGVSVGGSLQAVPLASFSDVFTYEPDDSMGTPYDDGGAQVYRFSRTVSAKGRPRSNAELNNSSSFNANACSGVKAFVDHRSNIDSFRPYVVTDEYRYLDGATVFNTSQSISVDLAELTYSVTTNGFYATGGTNGALIQNGAMESFTTTVSKEANNHFTTVTVDGTLNGYSIGAVSQPMSNSKAGQASGAKRIISILSNGGSYGYGSVIFRRAQSATSVSLNAVPLSVSVGDNSQTDGKISYSVSYDNRPTNIFANAISESINVSDTYPTDVFASIPIMGKRSGPVFQYMNTTTTYERDLSIEIVMDANSVADINTAPYGRLMNYSPSIGAGRGTINRLINDFSPAGTFDYVMLKQCNESWNPKTATYTLNIGWIYK